MVRSIFIALVALATLTGSAAAESATGAAPTLVPFASPESVKRLGRSLHSTDFFRLANHFESQTNVAFCGPTSAVVILNALRAGNERIAKPEDPSLLPEDLRRQLPPLPPGRSVLFRRYTQHDFFDTRVAAVKSEAEVLGKPREGGKPDPGIQLRQLGRMLTALGLAVTTRVVDDQLDEATVRRELIDNLGREGDYVIINYFRPVLGQAGGGHISPLGAYDQATDSFLILDVNPNHQPWVWVPAALLVKALRTHDSVENRGYLLVREGP